MTATFLALAGFCSLPAFFKVTRTPRAAALTPTDYVHVHFRTSSLSFFPLLYTHYLVVSKTRVLVGVDVQQVGGFRRELNTLTLDKEGVVVLDNLPDQFGTHRL
jgi:hypothetical protein